MLAPVWMVFLVACRRCIGTGDSCRVTSSTNKRGTDGIPITAPLHVFRLTGRRSPDDARRDRTNARTGVRLLWPQAGGHHPDLFGSRLKTLAGQGFGRDGRGGKSRINAGLGRTISVTARTGRTSTTQATVYAPADRRTLLHESVHGYCRQTFGGVGPVWYAEGMAEMGQYWKKDDAGVTAPDEVLAFLKNIPRTPSARLLNRISSRATRGRRTQRGGRCAICWQIIPTTLQSSDPLESP